MKPAFKALLLVEVTVCFAPAVLILLLGLMMTPVQIWFLFTRAGEGGTVGALTLICLVVGGLAGLIALTNLLLGILSPRSNFLGRYWTLLGALAGGAALMPYLVGPVDSDWWRIVGWMPLVCALHLSYLGRGFLFARKAAASQDSDIT